MTLNQQAPVVKWPQVHPAGSLHTVNASKPDQQTITIMYVIQIQIARLLSKRSKI
jgi:hypothetical protein